MIRSRLGWAHNFSRTDQGGLLEGCPGDSISVASATGTKSNISRVDSKTSKEFSNIPVKLSLAETSTEPLPASGQLEQQVFSLFQTASDGISDDELFKAFSEKLSTLVILYGDAAVVAMAPFIIGDKANAEVASAALNCLSHIEGRVAYNFRMWVIERSLQSRSSWVRDAAALGLESMDDASAIPYLQEAKSREKNSELHQYLQSVLEYLQRKR